jgi:hypothetical protein
LLLNRLRAIAAPSLGLRAESAVATELATETLATVRLPAGALAAEPLTTVRLPAGALTAETLAAVCLAAGALTAEPLAAVRLAAGTLTGSEPALEGLLRQVVSELMDRNANLLGHGILIRELLSKLTEYRHEMLCGDVSRRVAAKRILGLIVTNITLPPGAGQVGIRRGLAL